VHNFSGWDRSKLEELIELQSRTIEVVGMVLATPAPPETKVAEAEECIRHYQELKETLAGQGAAQGRSP
jgi:hypothetical protein